jgi:hypothetical protein
MYLLQALQGPQHPQQLWAAQRGAAALESCNAASYCCPKPPAAALPYLPSSTPPTAQLNLFLCRPRICPSAPPRAISLTPCYQQWAPLPFANTATPEPPAPSPPCLASSCQLSCACPPWQPESPIPLQQPESCREPNSTPAARCPRQQSPASRTPGPTLPPQNKGHRCWLASSHLARLSPAPPTNTCPLAPPTTTCPRPRPPPSPGSLPKEKDNVKPPELSKAPPNHYTQPSDATTLPWVGPPPG